MGKEERYKEFQQETIFKDKRVFFLPEYLFGEPMPLTLIEDLVIIANVPTTETEEVLQGSFKLVVRSVMRACQLQDQIFQKFKRVCRTGNKDLDVGDFVLKVTGFQEYLLGNSQLISYDYVRRCISKGEDIALSFVPLVCSAFSLLI